MLVGFSLPNGHDTTQSQCRVLVAKVTKYVERKNALISFNHDFPKN